MKVSPDLKYNLGLLMLVFGLGLFSIPLFAFVVYALSYLLWK